MSVVRILGLGANQFNSRDGIIVEGCKSILNIAAFDRYVLINDYFESHDIYPNEKFDLIVYCGTPFLWDGMQHTAKYKNTMGVIAAHPEAKVIWLGIGSSLYLGDETRTNILRHTNDQIMLQNTFTEDSLVFVRDSLAHEILTKAGVNHHFLPCPSYFFNPVCETREEYNIAFYHAPKTGIAAGYFNEAMLERYNNIFKKFVEYNKVPYVFVCEQEEIEIASKLFREQVVLLLENKLDTFYECSVANKVLSSRIHNAVPALVYGAQVGIVPVDSRHRVLTDFFDIKVQNTADLSKIKKCDIIKLRNDNMDVYRKLIKDYLNA